MKHLKQICEAELLNGVRSECYKSTETEIREKCINEKYELFSFTENSF